MEQAEKPVTAVMGATQVWAVMVVMGAKPKYYTKPAVNLLLIVSRAAKEAKHLRAVRMNVLIGQLTESKSFTGFLQNAWLIAQRRGWIRLPVP